MFYNLQHRYIAPRQPASNHGSNLYPGLKSQISFGTGCIEVPERCVYVFACVQLWATVGFSFNAPYTSSAATSRIKKSYDLLIAPLDQVGFHFCKVSFYMAIEDMGIAHSVAVQKAFLWAEAMVKQSSRNGRNRTSQGATSHPSLCHVQSALLHSILCIHLILCINISVLMLQLWELQQWRNTCMNVSS